MLKKAIAILTIGLLIPAGVAMAGPGKGKGQENKKFNQEIKAERKAYREQKKKENQAFKESLKNLPEDQRKAAMKEHRQKQQAENKEFNQKMHEKRMAALKERLAANTKLTDTQKQDLISFFESQYQDGVNFRDKQREEQMAEFEKICNDTALSPEQKKAAFKEYMEKQRAAFKEFREKQKSERKNKMQEMKPAVATPTAGTTDPNAPVSPKEATSKN